MIVQPGVWNLCLVYCCGTDAKGFVNNIFPFVAVIIHVCGSKLGKCKEENKIHP